MNDEITKEDIFCWADGVRAAFGTEYADRITDEEAELADAILKIIENHKNASQPSNSADEETPLCLCPLHFGDCEYCINGECESPLI